MQFRIELAKCSAERTLSHAGRPAENYETSGLVRAHDLRFKGQEAIRRGKRGGSSEQIRNSEDPLLLATSVGVSDVPVPVWRTSCPAAAGISCRGWGLPCWAKPGAEMAEDLWDELPGEPRCFRHGKDCHPAGRRIVGSAGLPGGNNGAAAKLSWPGGSSDRRPAVIGGGAQFGIAARRYHMLRLCSYRPDVPFPFRHFLFRTGTRINSTGTAVIADVIVGEAIDHG